MDKRFGYVIIKINIIDLRVLILVIYHQLGEGTIPFPKCPVLGILTETMMKYAVVELELVLLLQYTG